eukprot:364564-Chlamydomonas_euryale.AAC.7
MVARMSARLPPGTPPRWSPGCQSGCPPGSPLGEVPCVPTSDASDASFPLLRAAPQQQEEARGRAQGLPVAVQVAVPPANAPALVAGYCRMPLCRTSFSDQIGSVGSTGSIDGVMLGALWALLDATELLELPLGTGTCGKLLRQATAGCAAHGWPLGE